MDGLVQHKAAMVSAKTAVPVTIASSGADSCYHLNERLLVFLFLIILYGFVIVYN